MNIFTVEGDRKVQITLGQDDIGAIKFALELAMARYKENIKASEDLGNAVLARQFAKQYDAAEIAHSRIEDCEF